MKICIVGNGRSLLDRTLGADIDAHDVVVRCNCFSTKSKWAKYVGTQINVWAVSMQLNTPSKMSPFFGPDGFHFVSGLHELWTHRPSYPEGSVDGFRQMVAPWNLPIIVPTTDAVMDESRKVVITPSTGYIALLMALERYPDDEISLIGFGPIHETPGWEAGLGSYDYWTYSTDVEHVRFYEPPTRTPYRTVHDFNSEWEDMQRRAAEGQLRILTEPESFRVLASRPHPQVVVVGNSDELLTSERGPLIDAHDVVIRCNSFLVAGHERYAGNKTDIWALSPGKDSNCKLERFIERYSVDLSFIAGLDAVWIPFENVRHRQEFARHIVRLASVDPEIKTKIEFTREAVCKQVLAAYKNPSTGLVAIYKALDCYKVPISIIGFGKPKDRPRHYYSPSEPFATGQQYANEDEAIGRLKATGKVMVL